MEVSGQIHSPGLFSPRERDPSTHWIEGWVAPRALDILNTSGSVIWQVGYELEGGRKWSWHVLTLK